MCYLYLFFQRLEIDKELNDRVGLAKDYYNISSILVNKHNKEKALESLYNALRILEEIEKQNNYRHPFMEDINDRISYLKKES